jgi:hypothetical protein
MLVGTMEVLQDQETKNRIWRDGDDRYYPGGVTDPDYCVLRFTAKKCRMYENFHSFDFDVLSFRVERRVFPDGITRRRCRRPETGETCGLIRAT